MEDRVAQTAVAQAVEAYRKGLLTGNQAQLAALCMDEVSYGHSSGVLQTKADFIAEATSGKTIWKSLSFENPTNNVVGDTAICRCTFVGENETDRKTNALRFGLLMVWHKQDGQWKLLVRQGYKL